MDEFQVDASSFIVLAYFFSCNWRTYIPGRDEEETVHEKAEKEQLESWNRTAGMCIRRAKIEDGFNKE